MFSWRLLITAGGVIGILMVVYITVRSHKFYFVRRIAEKHRLLSWIVSLLPCAAAAVFCCFNIVTAVVVILHLALAWMLCDIVSFIVRKAGGTETRRYYAGLAAIAITVVYLGIGWINAHDIRRTVYTVESSKDLGGETLRVALIADAHLGVTLHGSEFEDLMLRIQEEEPDVLVIAGDFVDDVSSNEDMLAACSALGKLYTKHGKYFVYGNHDNGYYRYRDFTSRELSDALEKNGIRILRDETVEIGNGFLLCGRLDKSDRNRQNAQLFTKELDHSKYIIIADHQPNDTFSETLSGADLVLSGHTHGGHIWPAGYIGLKLKANDIVYGSRIMSTAQGHETTFIVTSGVSGWAVPFKTGTHSEYVIIDIKN